MFDKARDAIVEQMVIKFARQTIVFASFLTNYAIRNGAPPEEMEETRKMIEELKEYLRFKEGGDEPSIGDD